MVFHFLLLKSIDILIFCRQDPDCYTPAMFCQIILIYQYFCYLSLKSLNSNQRRKKLFRNIDKFGKMLYNKNGGWDMINVYLDNCCIIDLLMI